MVLACMSEERVGVRSHDLIIMSMLLIWVGPDGENIYNNFNLPPHQATTSCNALRNSVSQFATLDQPDSSSQNFSTSGREC